MPPGGASLATYNTGIIPGVGDFVFAAVFYNYTAGGTHPFIDGMSMIETLAIGGTVGIDFYTATVASGDLGSGAAVPGVNWTISGDYADTGHWVVRNNPAGAHITPGVFGGDVSPGASITNECFAAILHFYAADGIASAPTAEDDGADPVSVVVEVATVSYSALVTEEDFFPAPGTSSSHTITGGVAGGIISVAFGFYTDAPTDHEGTAAPPTCPLRGTA